MNFAARMARLGTETAFEVLARAQALEAQGKSVVHLEIGEPDFDTPEHIRQAAIEAIESGWTHYGPSAGLRDVREAIATYIEQDARHLRRARPGRDHAGRQADPLLHDARAARRGRRGDLSRTRASRSTSR